MTFPPSHAPCFFPAPLRACRRPAAVRPVPVRPGVGTGRCPGRGETGRPRRQLEDRRRPGRLRRARLPGSRHALVYPIVYRDIDYAGRFFSRGFDFLGAYLLNNDVWQVGADFQLDPTWRRARDDARLNGLGDVQMTVRARFRAGADLLVTLSADIAQDIGGQKQGLIANGDVLFSLPAGKWLFTMGPGVTQTGSTCAPSSA